MSDANPVGGMLYGGVGVCECHGQPVYVRPGGKRAGESVCHVDTKARGRARADRLRHTPHSCNAKGCERPAVQSKNGLYNTHCRECGAEIDRVRDRARLYDPERRASRRISENRNRLRKRLKEAGLL